MGNYSNSDFLERLERRGVKYKRTMSLPRKPSFDWGKWDEEYKEKRLKRAIGNMGAKKKAWALAGLHSQDLRKWVK